MDASDGLLRIPGVYFIFRLAIFFGDGEDTQGGERFEGVGWFWVEHADAEKEVITNVNNCSDRDDDDENSRCEGARRNHVKLSRSKQSAMMGQPARCYQQTKMRNGQLFLRPAELFQYFPVAMLEAAIPSRDQ